MGLVKTGKEIGKGLQRLKDWGQPQRPGTTAKQAAANRAERDRILALTKPKPKPRPSRLDRTASGAVPKHKTTASSSGALARLGRTASGAVPTKTAPKPKNTGRLGLHDMSAKKKSKRKGGY